MSSVELLDKLEIRVEPETFETPDTVDILGENTIISLGANVHIEG